MPRVDADRALRSLVNRSLVVPSEELKTFALVPLVADFLRKKKPEVVAETGDRLEKRAYALVVENGYENYDRFPVLDAAWPTVAAALPRFLAGPNDRLQTVCYALTFFLEFTGRWDEWLALLARCREPRCGCEGFLEGWLAGLSGRLDPLSARAIGGSARLRRPRRGPLARGAGRCPRAGVRHPLAWHTDMNWHRITLPPLPPIAKPWSFGVRWAARAEDVAIGLNDLADAEHVSGDLEAAERDYREALRIARAVDDHEGVAAYTGNLAALVLDREDWPGAEVLAREALSLSEKIGRQELIASDCHRLAKALVRQGKKVEALPYAAARRGHLHPARLATPRRPARPLPSARASERC